MLNESSIGILKQSISFNPNSDRIKVRYEGYIYTSVCMFEIRESEVQSLLIFVLCQGLSFLESQGIRKKKTSSPPFSLSIKRAKIKGGFLDSLGRKTSRVSRRTFDQ